MKKGFFVFLVLLMLHGLSTVCVADDLVNLDVSLGVGKLQGDTTYQIGGQYSRPSGEEDQTRFPLSKVEFPMNVSTVFAAVELQLFEGLIIRYEAWKSITKKAGIMKDSDWGIHYYNDVTSADENSLDYKSEGDTELNATLHNISLGYKIQYMPSLWIVPFVGRKYQKVSYEVKDLKTIYPTSDYVNTEYDLKPKKHEGIYMTYEVMLDMPYIGVGLLFQEKNFRSMLRLDYSNITTAKDKEEHNTIYNQFALGEYESAAGECKGTAVTASATFDYRFWDYAFLRLFASYFYIGTEGRQVQYVNGVEILSIEQKITSKQIHGMLAMGVGF